jgi:2-C-methyl-D-erythritol 4-phosphate cytidylyltransferase
MRKVYAIILAAGNGHRMGGTIAKQYQILKKKPVLCHTLTAFEQSVTDRVVLVVSPGMEEYAKKEIVSKYNLKKVEAIVSGGKERSDSVYAGMCYLHANLSKKEREDAVVLVHDGARPLVTPELIAKMVNAVKKEACAIPAVPVKDTIKRAGNGFVKGTPDRSELYLVQTPQTFHFLLLWEAFEKYYADKVVQKEVKITDDAMLVECMLKKKVAVVEGDYHNIKLTTPEDMYIARAFMVEQRENFQKNYVPKLKKTHLYAPKPRFFVRNPHRGTRKNRFYAE